MKKFEAGGMTITFPENPEEAKAWKPYITYHALARRVLVVATTRIEGAWKAYCDAVPGYSHRAELGEVLRVGDEIPQPWAAAMFPELANLPYAK